jgi:hypothetical protein
LPAGLANSNITDRLRCGAGWLACFRPGHPFANGQPESRRVQRQSLTRIGLKPSSQPSQDTPACPTSPGSARVTLLRRSDKRGCEGRLRSSICSKRLSIGRRRRELVFRLAAVGSCERKQGGQRSPHRKRLFIYESATSAGTKTSNDKNLLNRSSRQNQKA